jgi:hypothetical protein
MSDCGRGAKARQFLSNTVQLLIASAALCAALVPLAPDARADE